MTTICAFFKTTPMNDTTNQKYTSSTVTIFSAKTLHFLYGI